MRTDNRNISLSHGFFMSVWERLSPIYFSGADGYSDRKKV
nr:MAG TPA: hypothetical protein [Inoviridae sp.]